MKKIYRFTERFKRDTMYPSETRSIYIVATSLSLALVSIRESNREADITSVDVLDGEVIIAKDS